MILICTTPNAQTDKKQICMNESLFSQSYKALVQGEKTESMHKKPDGSSVGTYVHIYSYVSAVTTEGPSFRPLDR
jgi:hypothetical protein